jgi:hypothetical protein
MDHSDKDVDPLATIASGSLNLEFEAINVHGIIAAREGVASDGVMHDYPVVLWPVDLFDARVNDELTMSSPGVFLPQSGTQPQVQRGSMIPDGGLAGIAPHEQGADRNPAAADPGDGPSMPRLAVRIPGLGSDTLKARWRLHVHYDRGNGKRSGRNQREDTVLIPPAMHGDVEWTDPIPVTEVWHIHEDAAWKAEIAQRGFFGGTATLYCWIDGQDEPAEPFIRFIIGGINPDDRRCRHFIDAQAPPAAEAQVLATNQTLIGDHIETGTGLWFAYAVAKSESRGYNNRPQARNTIYNQFWEVDVYNGAPRTPGHPIWCDDGPGRPGGYGLFQVTGTPLLPNDSDDLPRREIWNWQDNVRAGLRILAYKKYGPVESAHAVLWMRRQKNGDNANGVTLPDHMVGRVIFSESIGSKATMEDALAIKAFNGASHPSTNLDRSGAPGFLTDTSVSGHYCFWYKQARRWALSKFNAPSGIAPFNYVDRVCAEVEAF